MTIGAPVCTKCGLIMRGQKNGFVVGFQAGRRYSSDQFRCTDCGAEIAVLARDFLPEPPANGVPVKADCMMQEDQ